MEREPVYTESGKMQRTEISEEPDHFTLLPDPRPAAQNRDSFSIPAVCFHLILRDLFDIVILVCIQALNP